MTSRDADLTTLDDLYHLLHACFGFPPRESVCAVALQGHRVGTHLRMDLPRARSDVAQVGRRLAAHLVGQAAEQALVLTHSAEAEHARVCALHVAEIVGAQVDPVVVAWSDGVRAWSTDDPVDGERLSSGRDHRLLAQAVLSGRRLVEDRAAVEAAWDPDPAAAAVAAQHCENAAWLLARDLVGWPAGDVDRRAGEELRRAARSGPPDGVTCARLALWLTRPRVRDRVWSAVDPETADRWWSLMAHVARSVEGRHRAVPYAMAGYAAYVLGEGTHAACAFERAEAAWPQYRMSASLRAALEAGVAPRRIHAMVRWSCREASGLDDERAG